MESFLFPHLCVFWGLNWECQAVKHVCYPMNHLVVPKTFKGIFYPELEFYAGYSHHAEDSFIYSVDFEKPAIRLKDIQFEGNLARSFPVFSVDYRFLFIIQFYFYINVLLVFRHLYWPVLGSDRISPQL